MNSLRLVLITTFFYAMTSSGYVLANLRCQGNNDVGVELNGPLGLRQFHDLNTSFFLGLTESTDEDNEPTPEQLAEASGRLRIFLGDTTGEAAIDKIMESGDADKDGVGTRDELWEFLRIIELGNLVSRKYWVDGLLGYFGEQNPKVMTRTSIKNMLLLMELY